MTTSFLEVNGIYNPAKRFAFTNITKEDFHSAWGGNPIDVKAGETVKLKHHLAVKLTTELVDKIMIGQVKLDETQVNQPYYRSPKGTSLGVPHARKVYEDQILKELPDMPADSAEMQIIRAETIEQLSKDLKSGQESAKGIESIAVPTTAQFADLNVKPKGTTPQI